MFARDMGTGLLFKQQDTGPSWLGDAVDDAQSDNYMTDPADPLEQQLHQLAQQMGPLRQVIRQQLANISNADATVDWQAYANAVTSLSVLVPRWTMVMRQIQQSNPYAYSNWQMVGDALLQTLVAIPVGAWNVVAGATDVVVGAPAAVLAYLDDLAQQMVQDLSGLATGVTTGVATALVPLGLAALGLVWLVKQGETTHTGRALTRRVS